MSGGHQAIRLYKGNDRLMVQLKAHAVLRMYLCETIFQDYRRELVSW
jgi:hypothetical protein